MTHLLAVFLRVAALALVVTAYMTLAVPLMGAPRDANIGAGLIAFGIVIVVTVGWSFVDGRRSGLAPTVIRWAVVAVVFSLGWVVLLAMQDGETSLGSREAVAAALALIPFTTGLVLVPSVVGAAIGQRRRREP